MEQIALGELGPISGQAYVGTPVGVAEVRNGKIVRVLAKTTYARALSIDGNALLVGQLDAGILRVRLSGGGNNVRGEATDCGSGMAIPETLKPAKIHPRSGDANALTVKQFLKVGETDYALARDGLLQQEPDGEWRRILGGGESQLTDRHISALMVASDGRLWVGYFDRGIDILPVLGGKVQHIENEHVFCVNRIVEDARHGAVAVATANGLVMFDRDGRAKAGSWARRRTDCRSRERCGALRRWYGAGNSGGNTFLDASGAHSLYAFQGLVNNHVYALATNGDQLVAGRSAGFRCWQADRCARI